MRILNLSALTSLCFALFASQLSVPAQEARSAKISPEGESSKEGAYFAPYLKGKAPQIVKELDSVEKDGLVLKHLLFRSLKDGEVWQDVYCGVARPQGGDLRPGILWVHGGGGCVEDKTLLRYAAEGYVVVAPELPGIAEPKKSQNSVGPWVSAPYGANRFTVKPDPTGSSLFGAVVAGIQAFDLLAAQPGVDKSRLGIAGISWGGFTTTKLSGLLGSRVKAAYSIYGCGFYERGSVFQAAVEKLPEAERKLWYDVLDAGREASQIKASYFIAAAARDHFFWPPAVDSTLLAAKGSNHFFAPEKSHSLGGVEGSDGQDLRFFAWQLKGAGMPFPIVALRSLEALPDGSRKAVFAVKAALPLKSAVLQVSDGKESWEKREWKGVAAKILPDGSYEAVIPAEIPAESGVCFATATDNALNSASSYVYALKALGSGPSLELVR